ncbi:unnamed protein product [Lampetra planeri]
MQKTGFMISFIPALDNPGTKAALCLPFIASVKLAAQPDRLSAAGIKPSARKHRASCAIITTVARALLRTGTRAADPCVHGFAQLRAHRRVSLHRPQHRCRVQEQELVAAGNVPRC